MKKLLFTILFTLFLSFFYNSIAQEKMSASNRVNAQSQWVYPGLDGKLLYKTTAAGDRIIDFSFAGYMGGGIALPTIPVKKTVQPLILQGLLIRNAPDAE